MSLVLTAMAAVDGNAPTAVDRVCVAAVAMLSLSGAGISLMVDGELRGSAGVSEPGIAAVQELQLSLGQGPCVDAWAANEPVLEPDLAIPLVVRWPTFAQAGVEAGVRAVFAFPLRLGTIRIGVLVLYRDRPGALNVEELARGLVLADVAAQVILALQAGAPDGRVHEVLAPPPGTLHLGHRSTHLAIAKAGLDHHDLPSNRSRAPTTSPATSRSVRLSANAYARKRTNASSIGTLSWAATIPVA